MRGALWKCLERNLLVTSQAKVCGGLFVRNAQPGTLVSVEPSKSSPSDRGVHWEATSATHLSRERQLRFRLCLSPLIERHNQKEIRRAYRRQRVVVGSYGPDWSDSGHHQQLTSRLRQSLPRFLSRFPFPHPFTSCRSAKPRREAGVPQVLRRPLR